MRWRHMNSHPATRLPQDNMCRVQHQTLLRRLAAEVQREGVGLYVEPVMHARVPIVK
jgi:hypothetical protein